MNIVRNIMRSDLVTVGPDMSVHELSRLLADNDISGAPVVDVDGEVLGVVSMTDVIRLAADQADINVAPRPLIAGEFSLGASQQDEDEEEDDVVHYFQYVDPPPWPEPPEVGATGSDLDQYVVREIMTPANFHVHPDSNLQELAEFLLRGGIHRALVMEDDRLVGIVTTVDLLRSMADSN